MIPVNNYKTFNILLSSDTQRELLLKQAKYTYGYGYGYGYDYGLGIEYFDVFDIDGDVIGGFGSPDFKVANMGKYGYGYGYERISTIGHQFIGVNVDEVWVTALNENVVIAFDDSTAINAGEYFLIPKNTTVGPISVNAKNAIYVKRLGTGSATVSILCTRNNKV